MALLSDLFDMDKETEKQIMDILKVVGIIALMRELGLSKSYYYRLYKKHN